jgi:hypothetical protein
VLRAKYRSLLCDLIERHQRRSKQFKRKRKSGESAMKPKSPKPKTPSKRAIQLKDIKPKKDPSGGRKAGGDQQEYG